MADIDFVLPIANYAGFTVDQVVPALLSGENIDEMCDAFQALNTEVIIDKSVYSGFLYDYLYNLCRRYKDITDAINTLRTGEGKTAIEPDSPFYD